MFGWYYFLAALRSAYSPQTRYAVTMSELERKQKEEWDAFEKQKQENLDKKVYSGTSDLVFKQLEACKLLLDLRLACGAAD